ncbi:MAG: efflux RND transporter periplasmic adaptor subunit [Burkholderiales bacterium]|nr:efflux RND transporter periplasmic adaptor subunit [Burkholderiales bacterium]
MKLKPTLLLLLTLGGAVMALAAQANPGAQAPYPTLRVGTGTATASRSVEGVVEAERQAQLSLPVQGTVLQLPVRAGDRLKAGQLLLRVDARSATQGATAAAAQQEAIAAQLQLAEQELSRQRQLRAQGFISQAALDQAQTQFRAAQAQLRAQAAQASAAGTQASQHALHAPFDGVLAELPVQLGDLALPGKLLATMYDPRALRVSVNLPLAQLPAPDAPLRVELAGQTLVPTRVERLPMVDAQSHTVQLRLQLPAGTQAAPGQFARVLWAAPASEGRVFVPRSALLQRGELDLLYVHTPEGRALLRQVRLGPAAGEQVEVLAGLKAGETVVLAPSKAAAQGAK